MTEVFDALYQASKDGTKFRRLMNIITNRDNILLAFRNIKNNKGSKTKGTTSQTIEDIAKWSTSEMVDNVRYRLNRYKPHSVRRVEIPKPNGKTRPLGIPTIEDRLIQQCIKQVLEPICEAKFHPHSYGFRPERSAEHAISRMSFLSQRSTFHYVVDMDIKGFFDNVNHGKLLKQLWSMGIQDKTLISIISTMLKAEIEGVGIPTKGTPQGGILSPLLANVVLNELDWWISNQWETKETSYPYKTSTCKHNALRRTKLKEMFIIRYADDFKIMCKDYETARRAFIATRQWLKERLFLEISEEKSQIVNLRKRYSDFLGVKIKVVPKRKKWVAISHISDKAGGQIQKALLERIKSLQRNPTIQEVGKFNAYVLGVHNYYKMATRVNLDFNRIAFLVSKSLYNRLKGNRSRDGTKSLAYQRFYGMYNHKTIYISGMALFPIWGIKIRPPMGFSRNICRYTKAGRQKIHENLRLINHKILKYLLENPIPGQSTEYNDNRISLYVGQNGKCVITKRELEIGQMEAHHKVPRSLGGADKYENLLFITRDVHKLIHATNIVTIQYYQQKLGLEEKAIRKVNKLRILAGNCEL